MSLLPDRLPFRHKPNQWLPPNIQHPIFHKATSAWYFLEHAGTSTRSVFPGKDLERSVNGALWAYDAIGPIISLNGVNGVLKTNQVASNFIGANTATLAALVRINSTGESSGLPYRLGSIINDPVGWFGIWFGDLTGTGEGIHAHVYSGDDITATAPYTLGEWTHVIMCHDASANLEIYIDGVLLNSTPSGIIDDVSGSIDLGINERNNYSEIDLAWAYTSDKALSPAECRGLYDNIWAPFERRIWVTTEAGPPGPVQLNIDNLRHGRPVDQVNVTEVVTLIPIDINALRHARRVDSISLGISVDLFVSSIRHGRPVDAIALEISVDISIAALRHGRAVDVVDLQPLVGVVLDVAVLRHGRPVDALLLDVEQPIVIDELRHNRPVDSVSVQLLLGDQTGIGATSAAWILDAGQSLNNATSVDFDYHVLEGIFDSDQSVLGVDGTRVTGPAGMRELTALTLGANVDGQERVQGEIAELRIYAGALSQADRDRILQELTIKWITG